MQAVSEPRTAVSRRRTDDQNGRVPSPRRSRAPAARSRIPRVAGVWLLAAGRPALPSEQVSLPAGGGLVWFDRVGGALFGPEDRGDFSLSPHAWTEDEALETVPTRL